MAFKSFGKGSDYFEGSETGNWNVAGHYVVFKIMRWLYLADEYETIATFGSGEMMEEFEMNESMRAMARMKAISRLNKTLLMIINNTLFAIKHKTDKEKMALLKEDLLKLEKVIPRLEYRTYNHRDKREEVKLDDEKFNHVLNLLVEIKSELNEPLNRSELIFMNVEEWNPEEIKKKFMDELVEGG